MLIGSPSNIRARLCFATVWDKSGRKTDPAVRKLANCGVFFAVVRSTRLETRTKESNRYASRRVV